MVTQSPTEALVVAHRGTNPESIVSVLGNLDFVPTPLSQSLFPGTSAKGIFVHSGFQKTHALSAKAILAAVQAGLTKYSTSKVYTVGHSLGGALSVLDAVYFKLNLPASVTVINRSYGLPRVGNPAFADYLTTLVDHSRTTNFRDPVPHLPLLAMGFEHSTGEQWINSATGTNIVSCPGQENLRCGLSQVFVDVADHCDPYNGVPMCTFAC